MADSEFAITIYSGLYVTKPLRAESLGWLDVVQRCSSYIETQDKFSVGGFGAHVLKGPARAVADTECVTLFVFDVDAGTPETNAETIELLKTDGLAAHFYSSHSHTPGKPALRLIIPPTRRIQPSEYPGLRMHLIQRFKIQCKPEQSADISRFWFDPSRAPGAETFTLTLDGEFFDPNLVDLSISATPPVAPPTWVPPPEPEFEADLEPYIVRLRSLSNKHARRPEKKASATYLRRMLKGEPLTDHGARNQVTLSVCGTLAFALPDAPVSVLMRLMRPSLEAMINAGSKLTEEKVHRMITTAMQKRAAVAQEERELLSLFAAQKARFLPK